MSATTLAAGQLWSTGPVSAYNSCYMYMIKLERIFGSPLELLQRRDIPYERRRYLLRQWRNERQRYINENFRDLDYTQDAELERLMFALNALKRNPRKYV